MEREQWRTYLRDPSRLAEKSGDSVAELETLRQRFPHCQVIYLLQCRAMMEEDRLGWKQRAREWAVLVPDRKRLFQLLQAEKGEGENAAESKSEPPEKEMDTEEGQELPASLEKTKSPEEPVIDPSPLEEQIRTEAVRDRILFDAEDALIEGGRGDEESSDREEEKQGGEPEGSEEETDKKEPSQHQERSFMDWLDPGGSSEPSSVGTEEASEEELIEAFISEGEELPKKQEKRAFFSSERMARNSSDESGLPVSETLAEIYVQQGDYKRAIQAFEQLRLNIPEKSDYFARRVQQIKERTKR